VSASMAQAVAARVRATARLSEYLSGPSQLAVIEPGMVALCLLPNVCDPEAVDST
jgi:hypothetical protein